MSPVKPIPDGYHSVTPYLIVEGAANAIEFYKRAFGAVEELRMPKPDGTIAHAEIIIGDSRMMLADEYPDMGYRGPKSLGGSPISLMIYVENSDATVALAVEAGATIVRPVTDQFYGDRSGTVMDPFGYSWYVATHTEDLSPEELQKRAEAAM